MSLSLTEQTLQLVAWFLALIDLILSLYILLLNVRHPANRHTSALLLLFAINTFAQGLMAGATDTTQAALPASLLAATVPALNPALLLVAIVLLRPRWRRVWWPLYGLVLLPPLLTLLDIGLGTRLWYTGLAAEAYAHRFELSAWATGRLAPFLRVLNLYLISTATLILLLFLALRSKGATLWTRRLTWLLLGAQVVGIAMQFGLRQSLVPPTTALITGLVYVAAYAYAAFQQMISERRAQGGRLQTRLMALILAITLPVMIGTLLIVTVRLAEMLRQKADDQLRATNRVVAVNTATWLDLNVAVLKELVTLPDIVSMDAARQKPVLKAVVAAHPYMYVALTTDLHGWEVARSDEEARKGYSDRLWLQKARMGVPLVLQTLLSRTTRRPALIFAAPIRSELGSVIGVGVLGAELTDISEQVQLSIVGESGLSYVVDTENRVVASSDLEAMAVLSDTSLYPPVAALQQGKAGLLTFTDDQGRRWRACVTRIDPGWGVITQQLEGEFLAPVRLLWRIAGGLSGVGVMLLLALVVLTVRQALRPVGTLTDTVSAITAGDLSRVAPIESEDELGALARAFNLMTGRLRDLIGSLEQQVAERTADLERRSAYLEATAEVGRATASILDADELIQQAVELIRERFGLYYVGLFLLDEAGEWAVLKAGTGPAGQALLARGHRIRVGEGMIGWSIAHARPRVALEVGEDAVRLATPELPDTRSEAALPLRSRGRVFGALTVQHTLAGAFEPTTLAVLQTMADQVAVALDNARLFAESQAALEAARRAYGEVGREAWRELLRSRPEWGYRYRPPAVSSTAGEWRPEMIQARQTGQTVRGNGTGEPFLAIPLKVRDQVVGVLGFRKGEGTDWTAGEMALLEAFVAELEQALESAQLYQETQRRAAREQAIRQVIERMRRTVDVEKILHNTVIELASVLHVPRAYVRLGIGGELQPAAPPEEEDAEA